MYQAHMLTLNTVPLPTLRIHFVSQQRHINTLRTGDADLRF